MATRLALAALLAMSAASGGGAKGDGVDGGVPDGGAGVRPREEVQTQTGPEVSGSRSDVSPPLRDLKPTPEPPGHRVHPWRRIPRPQRTPAEEAPGPTPPGVKPPAATPSPDGAPVDPEGPGRTTERETRQRTRKKPSRPPRSPRKDQDPAPPSEGTTDKEK
jgi:hypothetical protein